MSDQVKLGQILDGTEGRDAIHIAIAPVVAGEELQPGQHVGFFGDATDDTFGFGESENPLGVVDPFLRVEVQKGQRFYLWLYPNTVTGMRHEWTHSAFPARKAPKAKEQPVSSTGPRWRTPTVLGICQQMRQTHDYSALPILADAMEDGGYGDGTGDASILAEMRNRSGKWRELNACVRLLALVESDESAEAVHWLDGFAAELDQTYNRLIDAAELWVQSEEFTYDNSETFKHVDAAKWPVFWEHLERATGIKTKDRGDTFFTCSC